MFIKNYVGSKAFYKRVFALTLPIMIQNAITNFVSMLDNVMVGSIGTVEMTGVAVTNQLLFVFNLCIFGAISGAGIFGAQFYGQNDHEGVRHTFRFKLIFCLLLTLVGIGVFLVGGEWLIRRYMTGEGNAEDIENSVKFAKDYLLIMLIGMIPYTLAQCYSSTLRETDHSVLPMIAGLAAVGVNLFLNYVLIFGHFGAPKLGVNGAAIATVISRFAELGIVAIRTFVCRKEHPFIVGAFRSLYVPGKLVKGIFLKGMPLMVNETCWSAGIAILNQRYSVRGYDVVSANNICQTFSNVFAVAFISVGAAIGIILGQLLGARKNEEAYDTARKLIAFSIAISVVVGGIFFVSASFIPEIYNTTDSVKALATDLMRIYALTMPLDAFANAAYFTLRSGGKVLITLLFDSMFVCLFCVPIVYAVSEFTAASILFIYTLAQLLNIFKVILGFIFVRKRIWIRNIVD